MKRRRAKHETEILRMNQSPAFQSKWNKQERRSRKSLPPRLSSPWRNLRRASLTDRREGIPLPCSPDHKHLIYLRRRSFLITCTRFFLLVLWSEQNQPAVCNITGNGWRPQPIMTPLPVFPRFSSPWTRHQRTETVLRTHHIAGSDRCLKKIVKMSHDTSGWPRTPFSCRTSCDGFSQSKVKLVYSWLHAHMCSISSYFRNQCSMLIVIR